MKIYYSVVSIAFYLSTASLIMAAEAPVTDPIVSVTQAAGFGVWKIYNAGEAVYFIDPGGERYLIVESTSNDPDFIPSAAADRVFELNDKGTSTDRGITFLVQRTGAQDGLATEISKHLQDGRYGFGSKRFVVRNETITIFTIGDEDSSGKAVPATVLKKYSNELVHTGLETSSPFNPTIALDANEIPGPAAILGDCLATYIPATGHVEIPCLSIHGNNTVYRVEQQQFPGTLTFEVDPNEISRVQ